MRERKSGKETMRRSKKRRERVNQISVQCAKKNASTSHWLNRGTGEKITLDLPWEGHKKYESMVPNPCVKQCAGTSVAVVAGL